MKHAEADEFRKVATLVRKYLIIGNFESETTGCATHRAHKLHSNGFEVVTSSCATPSFARLPLIFKTRRLFAQTCTALNAVISPNTECIIYPSGLGIKLIDKPRWASRRMEEWRRYRLTVDVARKSKHCTLMLERQPPLWLTAALFLTLTVIKPFGLRITRTSQRVSSTAEIESVFALTESFRTQHPEYFALRANAVRLEKSGEHTALAADLRLIYEINVQLKRTGKTFLQTGGSGAISKSEIANHIPLQTDISQFMLHYNASLSKPFTLNNSKNRQDFITWYVHGSKVSSLPIPQSIAEKKFANMKGALPHQAKTILTLAHRVEDLSFLPEPLRTYFAKPMGSIPKNISRMELLCAVQAGLKPVNRLMFNAPWESNEIRNWYRNTVCKAAPAMTIFSTGEVHPLKILRTIEVKGVTEGQSGLSRNARMHAAAFAQMNKPLLRSLTLHNINADQIPQQVVSSASDLHVGFLLWELEAIPESHRLAGKMLDEIWVPSNYVQSIYEAAYNRPVVNVGKGIQLPKVGNLDMSPYGILPNHHVVLTCFDAHSSVERKNPLAAVQAFQQAFAGNTDARMFVKTTPTGKSHWGDPNGQMQRIAALAKRDPRIIIETRMFSFHDLLALINRADCVVSSHRAEGFGYIPAYALGYGRPVIATDYSGTTDICTQETAFLVKYTMRKVKPGETIVPIEASWADVDKHELANAMREIFENPALAQRKAHVGQQLIQQRYSPTAQAKRYAERLEILGAI